MTAPTTAPQRGTFAAMYEASRQASHDASPRQLRLDQLEPNPEQPRTQFFAETLEELAASVKVHGLLQPLLVRPHPSAQPGRYQIVAGERRYQACKLAGLEAAPVVIKQLDDASAREMALIENLQREDISPLEEAQALKLVLDSTGLSHREIGERIGKSKAYVEQRVRLLRYPEAVRDALAEGAAFTPGHAKAVVQVERAAWQDALLGLVEAESLSVRETERRAHQLKRLKDSDLPADRVERVAGDLLRASGLADAAFNAALARPVQKTSEPAQAGDAVDLRSLELYGLIERARESGSWDVDVAALMATLRADMTRIRS